MQRSDIEKELFYQSLDLVVNSNKSDKLIVLGDFNSHVGCNSELGPDVLGKHSTGNENGTVTMDCGISYLSTVGKLLADILL